jgi:hypothetical protein
MACFVAPRTIPPGGRSVASPRLLSRPELGLDPHDLDHPAHRGADLTVDVELVAALAGLPKPQHDRPHARAVDELELGEVEPQSLTVVPVLAQPFLDAVGDRDVKLTDQREPKRTIGVEGLSDLKRGPGECQ